MLINLKLDAMFKINKINFFKTKNRNFIDVIFNKFHEQNKLY